MSWSVNDVTVDLWPGEGYDLILVVHLHLAADETRAGPLSAAGRLGLP